MAQSLEARVESLRKAWNSGKELDQEAVLSQFADDVDFSDYMLGHLHIDKNAVAATLSFFSTSGTKFEFTSRSLSGTLENATWEATFEFDVLQDVPGAPYKKGERAKLVGVSLLAWNQDGKITKQSDYYCWVKPEEH